MPAGQRPLRLLAALLLVAPALASPLCAGDPLPNRNLPSHRGDGGADLSAYRPPERPAGSALKPALAERCAEDPASTLDVIARAVSADDLPDLEAEAEALGLEVFAAFPSVPAVALRGEAGAVLRLGGSDRLAWAEEDLPVSFFMERSVVTVNASKVWDTEILDRRGEPERIDGTGVTVVVLDTGIDADHPDLDYGEKTIVNLKSDVPGGPWYERRNTDTSYGHGTHCAGTVAGNGDASAGARRGVAPGAKLIGLSVGDIGITLTNVLGGLAWVYEHSRPGANPHNIRVVSNSWGTTGGAYDPRDAVSVMIERLALENNVVCVFAAGNDGEENHDGHEVTTSPYANTPTAVGVAALERDGSGVASFSSRGLAEKNETWPDVGAPGVSIWSAHARKTEISAMDKLLGQNPNPYYLAISGTSMATPHVAGVAALLFQACPGLCMSDRMEDHAAAAAPEVWTAENPAVRIHEVEWILEESARFLPSAAENGVPEWDPERGTGAGGRPIDFAQGHGLVQADVAVGIALTLNRLRTADPDREVTVADAARVFFEGPIMSSAEERAPTDLLRADWEGEYCRWNDVDQIGFETQNQTKLVLVPQGVVHLGFDMTYVASDATELKLGDLSYEIDVGNDGSVEYRGEYALTLVGHKHLEVDVPEEQTGVVWAITVTGLGLKVPVSLFNIDRSYVELRIEYAASLVIRMDPSRTGGNARIASRNDAPAFAVWHFAEPSAGRTSETVSMLVHRYDLARAVLPHAAAADGGTDQTRCIAGAVLLLLALVGGMIGYRVVHHARMRRSEAPDDERSNAWD